MSFSAEQVLYLDSDDVYGADELGLPYRDIVGEGIVRDADFAVTQRAAGANLSVDVAAGACWIQGDDDPVLQPTYRYREPATQNLAIAAADVTNPRVDRVVAEVLDSTFSGVSKLARVRVITGTPTSGANLSNTNGAASIPNTALPLANVLVPAGAASIVNADIGDVRIFAAIGGYLETFRMRGTGTPAANRLEVSNNIYVGDSVIYIHDGVHFDVDLFRGGTEELATSAGIRAKRHKSTMGGDLTAASTITVTNSMHRVLGSSVNLQTINGAEDGMILYLLNDTAGALGTTTGGNIAAAVGGVAVGTALILAYHGASGLWYPRP